MHYSPFSIKTDRNSAFSLLELSIVVIIVGVMISSIMPAVSHKARVEKKASLTEKMDAIEEALMAFRLNNDRLPCPSDITMNDANSDFGVEAANPGYCVDGTPAATTPTDSAVLGGVPVRTLGLDDDYAYDPWGRAFTFMVDEQMTETAAFTTHPITDEFDDLSLYIRDSVTTTSTLHSRPIAVVLSHGPNGHGGYLRSGARYSSGSTNADEQENCNCNSSAAAGTINSTFIKSLHTSSSTGGVASFDDTLRHYLRPSFASEAELFGNKGPTPEVFPTSFVTFDGTNDYVALDQDLLDGEKKVSFALWVRKNGAWVDSYEAIFIRAKNLGWAGLHFHLARYSSTDDVVFSIADGTLSTSSLLRYPTFPLDTWVHVVCTYEEGVGIKIYGDNVIKDTQSSSIVVGTDSTQFYVGAAYGAVREGAVSVKDFRAYTKILSSSERKYLLTSGASGSSPGSPAIHLKFDEGSGTSVANSSGGTAGTANGPITESTFWNPYTP